MSVASYFENNATAEEEKVKILQKRFLHQTWTGLVSSKTLNERLSHVWVLFQLDCAVLHWGDPMHRLHCSSTRAVCSLREPFITPWTDSSSHLRYCPVSVCTQTLSLESASLFFTCAPFWSAIGANCLGIAPVLVSLPAFQFSWANCVHLSSLCPQMVTRGKIMA